MKAQAGVAAGSVIQVAGTVTLHHGDAARPLAKGDTVEGDDIVETGADGSVVIELAHNHVTWELGANKKGKVRESLAWTQPKKDTSAKAVDEDSAAAGRHAERSAADTSVSGGAAKDVTAAAPPPAETETLDRGDLPAAASDEKKEEKEAEPSRRKKAEASPKADSASKGSPPAPPPPPKTAIAATAHAESAKQTSDTASKAKVITRTAPLAPPTVQPNAGASANLEVSSGGGGGGNPDSTAFDLLSTKTADLEACFGAKKMDVKLTIHVDAHGKATLTLSKTVPAAAKTCITKVVSTLKFAPSAATASLQLK